MLAYICLVCLVMPAPPQFPDAEPTSPLLRMKKRQDPHQRTTPMQAPQADQDIDTSGKTLYAIDAID